MVIFIKNSSAETERIEKEVLASLENSLENLESMLVDLQSNSTTIDGHIDDIAAQLQALNESLVESVPNRLIEAANQYAGNVTQHVEVFADWLQIQVRDNVGACQVKLNLKIL